VLLDDGAIDDDDDEVDVEVGDKLTSDANGSACTARAIGGAAMLRSRSRSMRTEGGNRMAGKGQCGKGRLR